MNTGACPPLEENDPQYPTVCLDEKPVVLHADVQPPAPVEPGKPERVDYEYERRGARNLFVMVEPTFGLAACRSDSATHQCRDYAKVVHWLVDSVYPQAEYIRLVQDKPPHAHPGLPLRDLPSRASSVVFCNASSSITPAIHGRGREYGRN